ncbi:protein of unknown function [Mucilaginibacter pineti]|uniref:IrrE N-terminal-like domain-containing protein n=1 Tax=Mucilaginibacter pineti TaxID=1391627 RepID=A0A1G7B2P2_9SPHI|nr:ImmA/IrrE family metallo-endopeptidase [Mucilaginibacter pineti]SDE21303.1 protein of unknown function [Mucilaginibacter pineti]
MILKHIEEKAIELINATNQKSAPIDVIKCAKHLGVLIEYTELEDDIFGLLVIKNKKPLIIVNTLGNNESRKRFTIAHELGHYLLHSQNASFFIDKGEIQSCKRTLETTYEEAKERDANEFATSLLVPNYLLELEASLTTSDVKFDIVRHLSEKFKVDEMLLGIKLSHLGLLEYGFSSEAN